MNGFLVYFQKMINYAWKPSEEILNECNLLQTFAKNNNYTISKRYNYVLREAINQKLDVCKKYYQHILDVAFEQHISLNYNIKKNIIYSLNSADKQSYIQCLNDNEINNEQLVNAFFCPSFEDSIDILLNTIADDKKSDDIISAIYVRAFYYLFPNECRDLYFSGEKIWDKSYSDLLDRRYERYTNRNISLGVIEVDRKFFEGSYDSGCNYYCNYIKYFFSNLDNYSELVVLIPPLDNIDGNDVQWELYADLILFSEKHDNHPIDRNYFRSGKIEDQTKNYIKNINLKKARFDLASEGFVFKDCFVVRVENEDNYILELVFEKDIRDERPINCPACRSKNVQGNSYPILNVRSWECNNPLCPDRSKYNRGKRFSYISYYRQKAMENSKNEIPNNLLAKWHLDSLIVKNRSEIFEMVCRFYSLEGDTIELLSSSNCSEGDYYNRHVRPVKDIEIDPALYKNFINSPYFYRYDYDNTDENEVNICDVSTELANNTFLLHGDSRIILSSLSPNIFDGAVTSPPYYNAKQYSQWSNIYCYLYDMRNIAKEVFRTLKDGGVYLYNIFDYFDNENNIVFSAMGKKRMILGAYTIDMFRRIGFKIVGNIIWDKGEIQGNRNFNQGNNTPYYQEPLNCWEHVLIFSKGEKSPKFNGLKSEVKRIKPYFKYVKGKNVLGHDAPFPEDIPNLLLEHMNPGDLILDPFSGSYTTGIAAYKKGISSVSIEKSSEYIQLSIDRFKKNCVFQMAEVKS